LSRGFRLELPTQCQWLQTTEADWRRAARSDLTRMLALIHLIRAFETRVLELKDENLVHGPVHASIGQEAVAAAVAVALRKSDLISSTHRAHGHFLAKALVYYAPEGHDPLHDGYTPAMQRAVDKTLAEIMGLRDGWCGGRGGSMHLYDGESGNLGSNAIVGGGIPIATGVAWAQRLLGRDRIVVSFFGDGAFNQGCFHEAANMATLYRTPVLYLVENNLYAVGTCTRESSCIEDLALRSLGYGFDSLIVDGMDPLALFLAVRRAAERMRREPAPFLIEAKTYRYVHHGGALPGSAFGYRDKEEEAHWQARDPASAFPARLIERGLLRPEQDELLRNQALAAVEHATATCTERQNGQRVIPATHWPAPESVTQFLRCDEDVFAGARLLEREDFTAFRRMTFVEAIAATLRHAMERDGRLLILGEEVANLRGGVYGATKGIKEAFPDRLINTPISETGFCGLGGGLAAAGLRPVVEIMYPDFALMASDQLFNQIGKLRHMYGGQVRFPLVLRTRIGIGFGYGGQHSLDPAGFFAQFPGWRILAPSNAFDAIGLLNTALRFEDPVLFAEHGKLYGEPDDVPADDLDYCIAYGKARVVRPGSDVTVLTYMTNVTKCVQAAEELAAEGISAEVIDLRTLDYLGMDWETIGQSVRKTGSVLIVEQAPRSLTLGARISDEIQERFFDYLDCPVSKVAGLDVPPPVSRRLEEAVIPSAERIQAALRRAGRHETGMDC
jgi:2-oxoisovalerate dehydrogenase E1 component